MMKKRSPKEVFALYENLYRKPVYSYIKQNADKIWSQYEDNLNISRPSNFDELIYQYEEEYFNLFKRLLEQYPRKQSFSLGFYNIDNFNAEASIIDDNHFIIVDSNLRSFYQEVILALYLLTYGDFLSPSEKIMAEEYINYSFHRFYNGPVRDQNAYIKHENTFALLAGKSHEYLFHCVVALYGVLYFILGHELGHFYYGHTTIKRTVTKKSSIINQENEYMADLFSYQLFLEITKNIRPEDNTNVSHHFDHMPLLMFDILELYYAIMAPKSEYHSHPQPSKRKEKLLAIIGDTLSEEGHTMYTDLLETLSEVKIHPPG